MSSLTERERLRSAVRHSRRELRRGLIKTRRAADLTGRIRTSMKKNLPWWIGGGILAGLVIASFSGGRDDRPSSSSRNRAAGAASFASTISSVLRFLLPLSAPILKSVLERELDNFLRSDQERDA